MKNIIKTFVFVCIALMAGHVQAQTRKPASRSRVSTAVRKPVSSTPRIVGKHMLSLQWLSWKKFGSCTISAANSNGEYEIHGKQLGGDEPGNVNDYLYIDGVITYSDPYHLKFKGSIRTKVYHINNGEEVVRDGEYDFARTENRKYWRMQQMENPADHCTDYVDIYFQ